MFNIRDVCHSLSSRPHTAGLGDGWMVRLVFFPSDEYPGVVFVNVSPHAALRPKLVLSQQCSIVHQDGSGYVYVLTKPGPHAAHHSWL